MKFIGPTCNFWTQKLHVNLVSFSPGWSYFIGYILYDYSEFISCVLFSTQSYASFKRFTASSCLATMESSLGLFWIPHMSDCVSEYFNSKLNFPYCIWALDRKHIDIKPKLSGSEYFNYKRTFSVVLMAIVDANYQFMYADRGIQGRILDGVFNHCSLEKLLNEQKL